jgi:hypothetical protein
MLNSLFGENYDPDMVDVVQTNSEFEDFNLKILRGDMFFRITDRKDGKPFHYHIECQTLRDRLIGVRVFIYDFQKAAENERLAHNKNDDDSEVVLYMPKSMVIHVEENKNIPQDYYTVKIVFDDETDGETIVNYRVSVMRFWDYTDERLIEEKLYPLLPLQVFLLRAELEKMSRRKSPDGKRETIGKIRDIADRIVREAHDLCDIGEISDEDLEKITTAIGELFTHLNDKYDADAKLNEEVSGMIKALYDERVFMRGEARGIAKGKAEGRAEGRREEAIEIAKSLLDVLDIETIAKKTKLTIEEVENLKNKGA